MGAGRQRAARGVARARRAVLTGLVALLAAAPLRGHDAGHSYLYLQVYEDSVSGRFEISLAELNEAFAPGGGGPPFTADNLDEQIGFLRRYYLEHVTISDERGPLSIRFGDHRLLAAQGGFVQLPFELDGLDGVPERLSFDYSVLFEERPGHRGFLLIEHNWATGTFANENRISLAFSPASRRQQLDLTSSGRLRGFLALVRLGAEHLLWGVDHLMFLFALLLTVALRREEGRWRPRRRFRPVARQAFIISSAFLVAHSVALSLAALGVVRLPAALVETAIAASTTLAAADVLLPIFHRRLWWIVFGLSLFHGLGFAAALLGLGVLEERPGLSLLAFNLGAELGQIAVVALFTPLLYLVRRPRSYAKLLLPAAAVAMILISGVWVIERSFGVDIPLRELLPAPLQEVIP